MILHIIKKDLRLLWPYVAGLAVLNAVTQWMRYGWSVLGNGAGWMVFGAVAVIGWIIVVAMLVHQDVIPGTRQDWLTRAIRRRDLLAAKLLFVVALLHVPLFVMMAIEVLAAGYALPEAVGAAFVRGAAIFIVITLPTLALATVTRNFVEAVIAAIVVAVVAEVAAVVFDGVSNEPCGAVCGTSLAWVGNVARAVVFIVAGFAVIALQYFRRGATSWARVALLVGAVGFVLAGRWPWTSAFSIQRAVTGAAVEASSVEIFVDADRPPAPRGTDDPVIMAARARLAGLEAVALLEQVVTRGIHGTTISVPLRVAGQPSGTVLWADRVELRLLDAAGRVVYRGRGDNLEVRAGDAGVAQAVLIPSHVFNAHRGSELRAELDYWLTLLEAGDAAALSASDGAARLASGEQCSTRPTRAGNAIALTCFGIHQPPSCYTAGLEGSPDWLVCGPSYWPDVVWPQLFASFGIDVPIPAGAQIGAVSMRVAAYEPRDHFTVQLVVPQMRLADWAVQPPQ